MANRRIYPEKREDYERFDRPAAKRKPKKSAPPIRTRKSRNDESNSNRLLSEFSSKNGSESYDLYVDEVRQKKEHMEQQRLEKKALEKAKGRKPLSPIQRKVRRIVGYCIILSVVLITCVILSLTVLFKTQSFVVGGSTHYKDSEILSVCPITVGDNIFLARKSTAEKAIKDAFAYVDEVNVSLKIPDTITIDITEAVPSYLVQASDKLFLVLSEKGRILEHAKSKKDYDLPLFIGPKVVSTEVGSFVQYDDATVLEIITDIVTTFSDNGYKGITQIDASNTAQITFTYDNRIVVKLGLPENIGYKIRTAMTIIDEKLDPNQAHTVEGELDVANSDTTKKSYFSEKSILDAQNEVQNATEAADDTSGSNDSGDDTQQPTEEETQKLDQNSWYVD